MRLLLFLLVLFISTIGYAQDQETSSNLFLEINAVRFSEVPGFFQNYDYENELDVLNGFRLGVTKDGKTEMYVSFMKYTSSLDIFRGFSGVSYVSTGYQLGIGASKILFQKNRFSGHIGGELLGQFKNYDGDYLIDYGPGSFSIDDIATFDTGIASLLQLNYRINDLISISVNTRFGLYYRFKASNANIALDAHNYFLYEPINGLSLRMNLEK